MDQPGFTRPFSEGSLSCAIAARFLPKMRGELLHRRSTDFSRSALTRKSCDKNRFSDFSGRFAQEHAKYREKEKSGK